MQFEYHPSLVEQAVFLASRVSAEREAELHQRVDRVYALTDSELKERAFQEAYAERFREWQLAGPIEDAICRWKPGGSQVTRCVIVPAGRASEEHVDLLRGRPGADGELLAPTVLIRVRPQALLSPQALDRWLQAELHYLTDMLDEGFGYRANDLDGSSWEQNVRRDRYAVLWRIHVAARLLEGGSCNDEDLAPLRGDFSRAFRVGGQSPPEAVFSELLHAGGLTHSHFMEWARDPATLPAGQPPSIGNTLRNGEWGESHEQRGTCKSGTMA